MSIQWFEGMPKGRIFLYGVILGLILFKPLNTLNPLRNMGEEK